MVDAEHVFDVGYARTKLLGMLLGAVAFVLVGIWLWAYEPSDRAVAALAILFFGHLALLYTVALLDKRPPLQIGSNGLRWRLYSEREINWHDIEEVKIKRLLASQYLVLKLRKSSSYPPGEGMPALRSSITRLSRAYSWFNKMLGFGDIQIVAHIVDTPFDTIKKMIERYRPNSDRPDVAPGSAG